MKFNTMRLGRPLSTMGSNLSVPNMTSGRKTNGSAGMKDSPTLQRASLYIFGEKSQAKVIMKIIRNLLIQSSPLNPIALGVR